MWRRLWHRLNAMLNGGAIMLGFDHYCGPACDVHAYCIGLQYALGGQHATLVAATDSKDAPAVYVFGASPDREARALAKHPSGLVRASFAYARVAGARTGLLAAGEIKP